MEQQNASNFAFLNGCFDELASIAKKAELLYTVDADSCAAKLRLFGELWLHEYNRVAGNKIKLSGTFGDVIALARQEKLIADAHYDLLEPLRSFGNLVSHVRFSELSQKASSRSITKTQLKSNFVAIMALADALVEKAGVTRTRSSNWIEPVDLISALDYQQAIYDNPQSVIRIAQKKLVDIAKLPHSKKRADLVLINAKIADCNYWLMKARSLDAEQADFESYLFFTGYYHPAALNLRQANGFKKQAILADVNGDVHFFLAIEEFHKQHIDSYTAHVIKAIEKGHLKALDHYLSELYSDEKLNDEFTKYSNVGVERNHVPCLVTLVTNKIFELQTISDESIKPANKEINRIFIKLKAMKSEAANFVDALLVATKPDAVFTSQHAEHLVNGAKSLPKYCAASSVALYAMYLNQKFENATKELIETGLRESEGTINGGAICFFAAMAILDVWVRTKIVLVPGLSTEKLIKKSASLGCQLAIDFENDVSEPAYVPRVIKNKRGIRKQTKARRKQSRKQK